MTDAGFRVFVRIIAIFLLVLGGFVMWETLWIRNGVDTFVRMWGDPLVRSVNPDQWKQLRPDIPPPDSNRLADALEMFVGWRASRFGLVGFIGCELTGAVLLLGSIRRSTRANSV